MRHTYRVYTVKTTELRQNLLLQPLKRRNKVPGLGIVPLTSNDPHLVGHGRLVFGQEEATPFDSTRFRITIPIERLSVAL